MKQQKSAAKESSGGKEVKRPRRDRVKKENEDRTIFVGNIPLTTTKKVLDSMFSLYLIYLMEKFEILEKSVGNTFLKKFKLEKRSSKSPSILNIILQLFIYFVF